MKRLPAILSFALVVILISGTSLRADDGPYMLVRVDVNPEVKVLPLLELGLDIVDGVKDQYVDVVCFPDQLAQIRALGYLAEVVIPDMVQYYASLSPTDDMGGFRTYSEAVAEMVTIHNDHPDITTAPFSIGQSIEGRELWVMKVSDNPELDEDEAEVFFNGLIHAREPIGMTICFQLLNNLTNGYGIDPDVTDMVDNREVWFLPILNPDGYVYNEQIAPQGGGMWRKNRRNNGGGSYGVDLNRNWGFNWGYNNIGSSGSPGSETYRGTAPFSEPETEAVRQFCNAHTFAFAQNFHSYGDEMLYSWSIPYAPWGYTPDDPTFQSLSQTMQQMNGYEYGPPWEILYEVNGDANDWMYGEQVEKPKSYAWVFEVGGSFWPSPSLIPGLVAENMQPAYFMIQQAANYMPTAVSLVYTEGVIDDDVGGNGNGGLDPGESALFTPTLRNNGWETGTGISATLIATDPYITITTNNATFPNLDPHASAPSNTPYALSVSSSCPIEHSVNFGLIWTCSEGFSDTANFTLMVGDPLYQPMGPDAYGYMAYDVNDEGGPVFNWLEIDPTYGGPGTPINFTQDDQTLQVNLPFAFTYYGQSYNVISVCSNGWIAMGTTTEVDWSNSHIPDADGPPAMIAPFWEDLSPQQLGHVAYYHDAAEHYFVVEFDSVRQYLPTTALETFEVVLYDPTYYPTLTGDGQILFQYNQVSDPSQNTVGIENATETIGLEVLYDGDLDSHMAPLEPGLAILFTTPTEAAQVTITMTPYGTPIQIPASGGSFNYNIAVANSGSQTAADIWVDVTLPSGSPYGPVLGPVSLSLPAGFAADRDRTQSVPSGAPAGTYSYNGYVGLYPSTIWDSDSFNFEKLSAGFGPVVEDWANTGESLEDWLSSADDAVVPVRITLSQNYPNPFNPVTTITYGLPENGFVSLKVFDLLGREVVVLSDGYRSAGVHQVSWDAEGMASGIYFYVLRVGDYTAGQKCLLVK